MDIKYSDQLCVQMRTTVRNKLHTERLEVSSWCKVFLKNFIVAQPVNKFPAFMMGREKDVVYSATEMYRPLS
jgi:hypothetical protein